MIKTEILSVRSPQWANEDRNAINCWVKTNTFEQEMPFTARFDDSEAHGREIYARCLSGEFGEVAPAEPKRSLQPLPHIDLSSKFPWLEKFLLQANLENGRKSFRSVIIVWGSLLDNLLDEMLEAEALRASNAGEVFGNPPRNFAARISLALNKGLITQGEADRCDCIRHIRNAAAHEWELSLGTEDILPRLRALHEMDHSQMLVFHEDLDFLLQQVYSSSCAMLVMKFLGRISG